MSQRVEGHKKNTSIYVKLVSFELTERLSCIFLKLYYLLAQSMNHQPDG